MPQEAVQSGCRSSLIMDDRNERPEIPVREVVTRRKYFVFWQSNLPEGVFLFPEQQGECFCKIKVLLLFYIHGCRSIHATFSLHNKGE